MGEGGPGGGAPAPSRTTPARCYRRAMLLPLLAVLQIAPSPAPACRTVVQACRACTVRDGREVCSTPGIACQPERTVCAPAPKPAQAPPRR